MIERREKSHTFRIWIAGDYSDAVRSCRNYTMRGMAVAIQQVDYIYTMGGEQGVCVTLINYPRFPATKAEIEAKALDLGDRLCAELFQGSFTVEGPDETIWISRRPQDQNECEDSASTGALK